MPARRSVLGFVAVCAALASIGADAPTRPNLPQVVEGWKVELVAQAPALAYPTAIAVATDGTIYLGQDPMDMPGPATEPIDSVVAVKDGRVAVFADKLWAVMGLEWIDGTLFVVHPPFLSAFRDTDGDGRADRRVDLITGLGPKLPGFNGLNDHIASGVRLGMDGFLYIAVGDKGIPRGVGKDGTTIQLASGGVIRVRPDGSALEVVSTGERNPLSVALTTTDEIFSYGNDDDSKKWPNSLTHHIVGGHYGYPYQFLTAADRCLPIVAGQFVGSGTQGVCYNEDGLPVDYRGNLFFCDWGLQTVYRMKVERQGGTFRLKAKSEFVTKGATADFRPFSLAVTPNDDGFYLVDWAFSGWLVDGPPTGRLFKLTYAGTPRTNPTPRPVGDDSKTLLAALDHPAHSVRLTAQRALIGKGKSELAGLTARLKTPDVTPGRLHALWALDGLNTPDARLAIREALLDTDPEVRLQAARSAGIRRDTTTRPRLEALLKDKSATVRREAAIALGKLGDRAALPALMAALADGDRFAEWSIRHALISLDAWDDSLAAALGNPQTRASALRLCDETWSPAVVEALASAIPKMPTAPDRARAVATLAGLYRKYPAWSGLWFGTNPLAGEFPQKTEAWDANAMARVRSGLTDALADASALVRLQAIAGLILVGHPALPALREALASESDPANLEALAQGLGVLGDFASAPALGALARDAKRRESVRAAALDALGRLRGPQALNARLMLVYDPKTPAALIARALPSLGREGILPANDIIIFFDRAEPNVRAAALRALTARRQPPEEVRRAVLDRLADKDPTVRAAATEAIVALSMREAVPQLIAAVGDEATREPAVVALAALPDPQALPVYLAALKDRNPEVRRAGESALRQIRDIVAPDLEAAAKSGRFEGTALLALERVLTRFTPLSDWRVIGPFPRTTGPVFIGKRSIDFAQSQIGAEGKTISWEKRAVQQNNGRVVLDDLKGSASHVGYDAARSSDLAAFGYTEIVSDRDREALLSSGSSGTLIVTLNEELVLDSRHTAGRAARPDSDLIRINLKKGTNRLLVLSRQGIGTWSFGVQVSEPSTLMLASTPKRVDAETLRTFALSHEGDPRGGEALFFNAKGAGCVKCHIANGQGTATIGPDLSGLAQKYDKAEIIRSVLEPSNRIANGYQPVVVATRDGKVLTGVVRSETNDALDLVDADAQSIRLAKSAIEERQVGNVSIMPAGLVDGLTVAEFADLISYLTSLKAAPMATKGKALMR